MKYEEFKQSIQTKLARERAGMTWKELQAALRLPYTRPCSEWTARLEKEAGLVRRKGPGNALIWSLTQKRVIPSKGEPLNCSRP